MTDTHAIVWLDHQHCRVICFSGEGSTLNAVRSENGTGRIHNKSGAPGSGHAADDHKFFDEIVHQVGAVPKVIVAGPGTAKTVDQGPELSCGSVANKGHGHRAQSPSPPRVPRSTQRRLLVQTSPRWTE